MPVRTLVVASDAYSTHADRAEVLRWLRGFQRPAGMTDVVRGESAVAGARPDVIDDDLGWKIAVPQDGRRVAL